jgi:hypothetical protein
MIRDQVIVRSKINSALRATQLLCAEWVATMVQPHAAEAQQLWRLFSRSPLLTWQGSARHHGLSAPPWTVTL